MREHLKQPLEPASPSSNRLIRQTLYLLATPAGWIADHSKKPASHQSFYTDRYELALSFTCFEAATMRAKAILDIEPAVTITPLEVLRPACSYPLNWSVTYD